MLPNSSISSSDGRSARYLVLLLCGMLVCVGIVAGLNLMIDPYRIYGAPDVVGLNSVKPEFVESLRMTTPYAIMRRKPDGLILGTSRAGRGLSLTHPAWDGLESYNAALPAVSLYEMWRALQHAQAVRPLRRVVLNLDNRVFYADRDNTGSFNERRLLIDSHGDEQSNLVGAWLPDAASSLLSVDALLASARTVRYQRWATLTLDRRGQWQSTGRPFDSNAGFRTMTINTLDRYVRYKAEPFDMDRAIQPLREILRMCHREGIDLRMLIPPSHAWHWDALRVSGMEARFDDIRRAIVAVNQEVAEEFGAAAFPLWDFSGYAGQNADRVPASKGERSDWFWETVHYKVELGNVVQDRIFGIGDASRLDFGVRIDGQNIEQHLADWHNARRTYIQEHGVEAAEFTAIYESWRVRHEQSRN